MYGGHRAAAEPSAAAIAFKLTPSYYRASDGNNATDLNLRGVLGEHTAWLGIYRDHADYRQERAGYENRQEFAHLRTTLSAQYASGGFVGGSVNAEIGDVTYAIVGWGRTNLRDYYNLNFDPNDAITLGLGSRALSNTELSLFHIWDDRLETRQHVTHAVVRYKPDSIQRWTTDLSYKRGLNSDGLFTNGYAATLTYDYGNYFARIGRDQYVNFSTHTQTTFALGLRF